MIGKFIEMDDDRIPDVYVTHIFYDEVINGGTMCFTKIVKCRNDRGHTCKLRVRIKVGNKDPLVERYGVCEFWNGQEWAEIVRVDRDRLQLNAIVIGNEYNDELRNKEKYFAKDMETLLDTAMRVLF